jgi:predicted oxidoreductase
VRQPIVANQLELNVVHAGLVDQGVIMNREQPTDYDTTGTLEYCRQSGITIQPWGPLGKGLLVGREINAAEDPKGRWRAAAREVAALAEEKRVSREAICVAWILHHPARMQPIFGSTKPDHVRAAADGAGVTLTRNEWYRLFIAGRGGPLP